MTLRYLADAEPNRDSLRTEISANAGHMKGALIVPTGYVGTGTPTGYGTSIIPTG